MEARRARRRRLDVAREGNDGVDRVCAWGPRDGTRAGDARPHRANEDVVPKGGFRLESTTDRSTLARSRAGKITGINRLGRISIGNASGRRWRTRTRTRRDRTRDRGRRGERDARDAMFDSL